MAFFLRLLETITAHIVILYGIMIEFVESMNINYEEEYARLGHVDIAEEEEGGRILPTLTLGAWLVH